LKAIAAGEHLPYQDALLIEAGISSGSASMSTSSGDDNPMKKKGKGKSKGKSNASLDTPQTSVISTPVDEFPPEDRRQPIKMKKGKKGVPDPTEGYLSLGKGKTGRGLPQADISKMISIAWKRETPEVRKKYEQMSEKRKQEVRFLIAIQSRS